MSTAALYGLAGLKIVIAVDLISFAIAFVTLAFSRSPLIWCIGKFIGWMRVPIMSANLDIKYNEN